MAVTFRTKLLAAIAVVAAAAAIATMLPAQRALQSTHERFFHERFRQQVAFAGKLQERRIQSVAEKCRGLASSVRLLAALDEGDIELIYDNARDELREVLAHRDEERSSGNEPPRAAFVRFLAADGHLMQPPHGGSEFGAPAGDATPILESVRAALGSGRAQDLGWAVSRNGGDHLYEVVVTAIDDPVGHERAGALVLGFEASPGGGVEADRPEGIELGLMVGDSLHLAGVAQTDREQLVRAVERRSAAGRTGALRQSIAGVPHLVLFEQLDSSPSFPSAHRVGLYSLQGALAERAALRRRALTLLGLALTGGLLAGGLLAHGLAIPVRNLSAATRRIRGGDFDVRVPVRSRDELGQLSESFNEMAEGLALKERYRHVLDVVADRGVAEQLLSGDLALGGESREVSVVFCDIRGFTKMANALSAEEVVAVLNEHMTALTRVVYEHHGVVDKFVGDLVMAVFGAPKSYGDDALSAVRCAEAMVRERERLNERATHAVRIGVAVATGRVVAGCTGSADRLSYTVLGAPVNLVSRLCNLARPMEVLLDQATYQRVRDVVPVERLPDAEVKGFDAPVAVYRVAAETQQRAARA